MKLLSRGVGLRLGRVTALAMMVVSASASMAVGPLDEVRLAAFETLVEEKFAYFGDPSLSAAIGWDGRVRFADATGYADLEHLVEATTRTRYRIASITKPMTAIAVLQLVEQGKLDLDADIREYVPEFTEKDWVLTLRDILSHQSGVRHYGRPEADQTESFVNLSDSLSVFAEDELVAEPGQGYSYSTYAYTLAGVAVERASGKSFEQYLKEHIWGPAGMTDTFVDSHFEIIPHRARPYTKVDADDLDEPVDGTYPRYPDELRGRLEAGDFVNGEMVDTSVKTAGGGLISTPSDLVRFGMASMDGTLLSDEMSEQMWTTYAPLEHTGGVWKSGLGWFVIDFPDFESPVHAATGGASGSSCSLIIESGTGVVAAVTINQRDAPGSTLVAVLMIAEALGVEIEDPTKSE